MKSSITRDDNTISLRNSRGYSMINTASDGTHKRRQLCSTFFLLGMGVLVCVFCYATYFPRVLWISTATTNYDGTGGRFGARSGPSSKRLPNHLLLDASRKDDKEAGTAENMVVENPQARIENYGKRVQKTASKLENSTGSLTNPQDFGNLQEINYSSGDFPASLQPRKLSPVSNLAQGGKGLGKHSKSNKRDEMDGRGKISRSCNFPRLNPFDPTIKEFIKDPPSVDCFAEHPLLFRTNFHNKLIQVESLENASCCYKTLSRGNDSDLNIRYSKTCYNITLRETEIPSSHEFIQIKCSNLPSNINVKSSTLLEKKSSMKSYKDMLAFVPLKPQVEARIKAYELEQVNNRNKSQSSGKLLPLQQPPPNEDKLSIIILGLDAQSHMNFIRQMPRSYNFLVKNLSAIGLNGYTKVGDNTFPNVVPLLSGLTVAELKNVCWPTKLSYFDECPFIWRKAAASGYRTSFAEDSIWMGTFNYEKRGFRDPPTDYYFHPMGLLMAKKIGHETWGNAKLCYGPRLAFEVLLDYVVKTAVAFRNKLYFQYIWANSLFHDYLNNPKLGDELLYLSLQYLSRNGFLNNTAFVLLSDHGIRWGSIRSTYQGKIEERMPLAYFTFPPWFRTKYADPLGNLRRNSDRLTTPFDIFETLMDILDLNGRLKLKNSRRETAAAAENEAAELPKLRGRSKSKSSRSPNVPRGISLFQQIPLERTCKAAGIEEHWCVCDSMRVVRKDTKLVQSAARFIVYRINLMLEKFRPPCQRLELVKINEAMRKIDGDLDPGGEVDFDTGTFTFNSNSATNDDNITSKSTSKSDRGERFIQSKMESLALTSHSKGYMDNVNHSFSNKTKMVNHVKTDFVTEAGAQGKENKSRAGVSLVNIQLQISLVTQPGDAVFEATVYGSAEEDFWKLSGDISRLNLYREQSLCISDAYAQKFCYCANQLGID